MQKEIITKKRRISLVKKKKNENKEININIFLSKNELNKEIIIQSKPNIKKINNFENSNNIILYQQKIRNGIIINKENYELIDEKKERQKFLFKKIIMKKYLKHLFNYWFKVSAKKPNSFLNGIYGYCYFDHYTDQVYFFTPIHGKFEFGATPESIQPVFSDFLRKVHLSVAAFNLFTFYSQLHDISIMIKKKYLLHWKKSVKSSKVN